MKEFLCDSVFFGVAISILAYELGVFLKKKLKLAVFNPLLISIVAVIVFLVAFHIPYESYNEGAKYLSYLLTPATVCLAIPLYEQFELLKQNVAAIFAGLISGVLTSVICVLVLSLLFHFDHAQYVTLLPKSITTAIGMGISEELGGYVTITVAVIIITRIILTCTWNSKGIGTWRDRRCHEQPFHCSGRYSDGNRCTDICDAVVNMGVAMTDVQFSSQKLKTIFATRILVEK